MQAVPEEFCGNLVVFPGSHTLVAEATRDPSTMDLLRREGTFFVCVRSRRLHAPHTRLGMPALHDKLPVVSKPLQIIAEAGDVLVAHSSLPHSVAPNVSSSIRYALYFRVNSSSRCGCGWAGWRLFCVIVVRHATLQGHARHRRRRPRPFAGHVRPLAPLAARCLARIAYALSSTCGCARSEIFAVKSTCPGCTAPLYWPRRSRASPPRRMLHGLKLETLRKSGHARLRHMRHCNCSGHKTLRWARDDPHVK